MLGVLRSTWFRLVVTVAILVLAFAAMNLEPGQVLRSLVSVDPRYFALTLVLVAVDRVVMAVRWQLLLRAAGVTLPFGEAIRIFLVSSFVGSFLPAGVGADASRAYSVAVRTSRKHEAVASIAVDRLLGLLAIVVLGVVSLAAWTSHDSEGLRAAVWALALLALAGCGAAFWIDRLVRAVMPEEWWRRRRPGRIVLRLGDAIGRYRGRRGSLLAVFLLSLAVQSMRVLQAYCLGLGFRLAVPLGYYFVFMSVGLLLLLLPISVSGFGVPQVSIVWLLQREGVPEADAFALSTLILLAGLIGNLPGAWLYLQPRRREGASSADTSPAAENGSAGPPRARW